MQIYSSTGLLTFKSMFYHDFYSIFSAQNLSQHKTRFKPEMEIMDKSHGLVVATVVSLDHSKNIEIS